MTAEPVRRITADQLRALIEDKQSSGSAPLMVDVREAYEFATGHIEGSVNIPLSELQHRIREIPPDSQPVFICQAGARSMLACHFALSTGIASPANLEGGMNAWQL